MVVGRLRCGRWAPCETAQAKARSAPAQTLWWLLENDLPRTEIGRNGRYHATEPVVQRRLQSQFAMFWRVHRLRALIFWGGALSSQGLWGWSSGDGACMGPFPP